MKIFKLYAPAMISTILFAFLAVITIRESYSKPVNIDEPVTEETKYVINSKDGYTKKINNFIKLINIENFYVNNKTLEEYLANNEIEKILIDFEQKKVYSQGILFDNNYDGNEKIVIIKCNNNKYIIGNEKLKYEKSFCE